MVTTIPFKILTIDAEGYHLTIKIRINGKFANVIIDTGASKTVFDLKKIEKYVTQKKFDKHEKLSTGLGSNKMKSQTTTLKKILIGDVEIINYTTVLLDLSHVNKSYELIGLSPIEGVLGSDILLKYKAVIDFEKKILKLKHKKAYSAAK
ncbi:MAG: clan AA aspartic protease [Bacteroidetes bacterium]|nr:clan AA aspartic protease [Bacteroidota bacterium]